MIAFILSIIFVCLRDLTYILDVINMIVMRIMSIYYPIERLPRWLQNFNHFNPFLYTNEPNNRNYV